MGKTIHYGIKLQRFMDKNGTRKKFIAEKLGLSRPWLDEMLETGNFTPEKLKIVKKIIAKK